MNLVDVVEIYTGLHDRGIEIWLDGGWGVDALLGEQTRPHDDLDIVIQEKDVPALRTFLEGAGFTDVPRDDTSAWNFVLGHPDGRLVDVHVIIFDDAGNGLYGRPERGIMYRAASLTGTGSVGGVPVKCIAPEYLVQFHTGYKLRPSDLHDVSALCERFGIPYPQEYLDQKSPEA